MKIAFTAKGTDWDAQIDPRFGRTEFIVVYDEKNNEFSYFNNQAIADVAHGAGPQTAQKIFEMQPDVLITGNGPGGNAASVLQRTHVTIYVGAGDKTIKEAYDLFKEGKLQEF